MEKLLAFFPAVTYNIEESIYFAFIFSGGFYHAGKKDYT